VVTSIAIFNGVYPAITRSSGAVSSAAEQVSGRIESDIEIIHVSVNATSIDTWVKNVGTAEIVDIEGGDVFYGLDDDFSRVSCADSGPPFPYWDYQLEGGNTDWRATVTLRIIIHLESSPSAGTYLVKVVTSNGISDQKTFSVD
jgi:hypothetical protein